MSNWTLGDLKLGLRNLPTDRRVDLERSGDGKTYAPMLDKKLEAIEKLPVAVVGDGRPGAQELLEMDDIHDGLGQVESNRIESNSDSRRLRGPPRRPGGGAAGECAEGRLRTPPPSSW